MSGPQGVSEAARVAGELVQEIIRVFKVRRLYEPGHPQRLDTEETAAERIQALLAAHGAVTLDIEEDTLQADGTAVYQQEGTKESLAFLLHREGLRQLVLHPGLEPGELTAFLDRIGAAALAAAETDLIAQLWEERFVHIRFAFVERLADEEWTPPSAREEREEEEDRPPIQLATEDRDARPTDILKEFDSTLYFLDEEDMAALQAELEAEKSRALLTECLTMIRELLMNPVRDDPGSLLAVLVDIQAHLIEEGQYGRVQELHAVFVPYLDSRAADDRSRRAFQELRRLAIGESTLSRLAGQLDAGVVTDSAAAAYYRAFGASDVALLLAGAGDLKKLCQRAPLADAFRDLARANPNALRTALGSSSAEAAEAAAYLTGLVGDPRLLDALGTALQADEPAVRREALLALKQFGGGRALELVARAIHDPDPGVRLYALRHVVSHRYAPALARVAELLDREAPEDERSMTERRLLFEAYGALGGSNVVEELARRLRRRGGLFRKTDPEEIACVLVGLGATTAPAARAIIESALDDKQPLVSRTARQVLDTWGSPVAWSV